VTATDTAGNTSPATSLGTWTIDTSAPVAPTVVRSWRVRECRSVRPPRTAAAPMN
jgi:hypothetical protein